MRLLTRLAILSSLLMPLASNAAPLTPLSPCPDGMFLVYLPPAMIPSCKGIPLPIQTPSFPKDPGNNISTPPINPGQPQQPNSDAQRLLGGLGGLIQGTQSAVNNGLGQNIGSPKQPDRSRSDESVGNDYEEQRRAPVYEQRVISCSTYQENYSPYMENPHNDPRDPQNFPSTLAMRGFKGIVDSDGWFAQEFQYVDPSTGKTVRDFGGALVQMNYTPYGELASTVLISKGNCTLKTN